MTKAQYKLKQSGMSAIELATELGVNRSLVYQWISGVMPRREHQERLSQLLDIQSDWVSPCEGYELGQAHLQAVKDRITRALASGDKQALTSILNEGQGGDDE